MSILLKNMMKVGLKFEPFDFVFSDADKEITICSYFGVVLSFVLRYRGRYSWHIIWLRGERLCPNCTV